MRAIFEFDIKNASGRVQTWTLDVKNGLGTISLGKGPNKADITLSLSDDDFMELASGRLNGIFYCPHSLHQLTLDRPKGIPGRQVEDQRQHYAGDPSRGPNEDVPNSSKAVMPLSNKGSGTNEEKRNASQCVLGKILSPVAARRQPACGPRCLADYELGRSAPRLERARNLYGK